VLARSSCVGIIIWILHPELRGTGELNCKAILLVSCTIPAIELEVLASTDKEALVRVVGLEIETVVVP